MRSYEYYCHEQFKNTDPFGDFSYTHNGQLQTAELFYSTDYGCIFGLGYGHGRFRMGVNYWWGLKNIGDGLMVTGGSTPRNQTWNISLGYAFKTL